MMTYAPQTDPATAWLPALLLSAALFAALPGAGFAAEGSTSDATLPDQTADPTRDAPNSVPAAAAGSAANVGPNRRCDVPPEVTPAQAPLPALSRALKAQAGPATPVTIVVLGSLSSANKGDARGVAGFPARLQARLASRLAERGIDVPVRIEMVGRTRALAGELAGLIRRQVLPLKPTLVIWQAGRADARKGNPPYRFGKGLAEGLDILQKQNIATILADIQFHPQFEALYRTDDYRNYVRWIAGERDLPLLRRYEMIEYWATSHLIDLDSANDAQQQTAYAFIQECLAFQAARMIMEGAGLAP